MLINIDGKLSKGITSKDIIYILLANRYRRRDRLCD